MAAVLLALLVAIVLFAVGVRLLRFFGQLPPEPLPTGEMRKVDFRYRCSVCGAEARLTRATDEDPEPPRHCMEDMDLVPGLDD